jgi:hypothetical protein
MDPDFHRDDGIGGFVINLSHRHPDENRDPFF